MSMLCNVFHNGGGAGGWPGDAMAFLNSAAAFGINGIALLVDYGHIMASLSGAYPPGKRSSI
ncbi:hypothetical protein MHEI_25750 [Mycobacterium heidelbergense]|nr:hypothetical protein MHEI_25750 [Mycobacterium heidelbergense]